MSCLNQSVDVNDPRDLFKWAAEEVLNVIKEDIKRLKEQPIEFSLSNLIALSEKLERCREAAIVIHLKKCLDVFIEHLQILSDGIRELISETDLEKLRALVKAVFDNQSMIQNAFNKVLDHILNYTDQKEHDTIKQKKRDISSEISGFFKRLPSRLISIKLEVIDNGLQTRQDNTTYHVVEAFTEFFFLVEILKERSGYTLSDTQRKKIQAVVNRWLSIFCQKIENCDESNILEEDQYRIRELIDWVRRISEQYNLQIQAGLMPLLEEIASRNGKKNCSV